MAGDALRVNAAHSLGDINSVLMFLVTASRTNRAPLPHPHPPCYGVQTLVDYHLCMFNTIGGVPVAITETVSFGFHYEINNFYIIPIPNRRARYQKKKWIEIKESYKTEFFEFRFSNEARRNGGCGME